MVLPSTGPIDTQAIETEFQLGTAVQKALGTDLGPLIAVTAGTAINQAGSFYGKAYGQAVTSITQGTTTSSAITLNWSGGAGATSFSITSSPATTTQTASASGYNFTGLSASTAYTFTIVSKNAQGVAGGSATSGSFTTSSGSVNITGVVTTFAGTYNSPGDTDGTGTGATFRYPRDVCTDGAGNLYVSCLDSNRLRKIVISTKVVTTPGILNSIYGITYDGSGAIYYVCFGGSQIRKFNLSTSVDSLIAGSTYGYLDGTGTGAQFANPRFITYYAGNLYVTDSENHVIRKVTTAGVVTTLAGRAGVANSIDGTGTGACFAHPYGIVSDGAGNLYNVDEASQTVRKTVISTGVVTTLAGSAFQAGFVDGVGSAARFNYLDNITIDPSGTYLYVADSNNNAIRKIVISTRAVTTIAGTTSSGYVDGTGSAARFSAPFGVCVAGSTLYVCDFYNQLIRAVT